MNGNQFAVMPGGNMTEGLAGIGDVLKDIGDQKKEREAQEADQLYKRQAQAAVSQALESGDLDQINRTAVEYPEFGDIIYTGMNAKDKDKQARLAGHLREVVNAPPDQVQPIWEKRIQQGELEGRDMTDSRRELDAYLADPEGMKKGYEVAYAATASPQEYKAWQESRAPKEFKAPDTRTFEKDGVKTTQEFDTATGKWNEIATSSMEKPDKFQSDVGKLIGDREAIVKQYGEGSQQATAIDEAINASKKGDTGPKMTDVSGLRKEFTGLSSPFIVMRDAYNKISSAPEDAAGDLSLIFSFMKILDPGSVVREQEFANAQNAAGVPDQVRNAWNKALTGERLAPGQRDQFKSTGQALFDSQMKTQLAQENVFRKLAERQEMDPDEVVVDFLGDLRPRTPDDDASEAALIEKYTKPQ